MVVKNDTTKTSTSGNTATSRKLLNKQSKNLSTHGSESLNMSIDEYSTPIVITKSASTQTGGIGSIEKNERQIIRPKTAKINR